MEPLINQFNELPKENLRIQERRSFVYAPKTYLITPSSCGEKMQLSCKQTMYIAEFHFLFSRHGVPTSTQDYGRGFPFFYARPQHIFWG